MEIIGGSFRTLEIAKTVGNLSRGPPGCDRRNSGGRGEKAAVIITIGAGSDKNIRDAFSFVSCRSTGGTT